MIPAKIVVLGDENKAAHYRGMGREFLRRLVHSMSFRNLEQLEDTKRLPDGTVIHCVHRFGESVITIYCPYDVPEKEEREEEIPVGGRKAHFFIKYIVPQGDRDPDCPPPPRTFDASWVWFEKDAVYGTQVQVFHDVEEPVPPDAVTNVGAELPLPIQKITLSTTTENFGGKAFELSYKDADGNEHTKRYASYTGNVPLLFREGKLLYKGAPCLETYQDADMVMFGGMIYMANMHKMIVQNDKHVAWYYFKQEPYFVQSIRGEMDMRFTVCTMDLVTIVGDEMEIAVPTPRAKMRGSGTTHPREGIALTWDVSELGNASISLFNRKITLAQWLKDWASPWAGWIQIMQFPQGMQMLLDIKEIDPQSFADDSWVTLFMSESDSLAESRYYLHPDAAGDMGYGFDYSYGGYAEKLSASLVESASTWLWTKEGFEQWDSLEFDFAVQAHRRWASQGGENLQSDMGEFRHMGLFGFDHCQFRTKFRYGGVSTNHWPGVTLPWIGTIAYGLGFLLHRGQGTGLEFRVNKRYDSDFGPFQCEPLQRYYKHGGFGVGGYQTGDGYIWGPPILGWGEGGSQWAQCRYTYYTGRPPFTFKWQVCYGSADNVNDTNNFNFLWHETYNDPWATGCQMFTPNIFLEKGRRKVSADNSTFHYNQQHSGPIHMLESEFGAPPASHWASKDDAEAWYSLFNATGEPIPFSCDPSEGSPHHNPADWRPITGYMSGGGERRSSSWSASDSTDETILHCSDGEAAFTLPADAWEYYFMDDRSVDDEPQGVFLACKTATTWRFFHFWESAHTFKEVTNEIWKGLGFDTPQQRVSIQCIGVI